MPGTLTAPHDDEHALHFYLREGQTALRWTVGILFGVTLITMPTFWFWAIIPAMLLVLAVLALLIVNYLERRSDHPAAEAPVDTAAATTHVVHNADQPPDVGADGVNPIVSLRFLEHETKVIAAGVAAVLILATAVAVLFFGGIAMLIAIPFIFAYFALIAWPVWLAAIEDDIEDSANAPTKG